MDELEAVADALDVERRWARQWLFEAALPLWWEVGADRTNGGYFDRLDQQARSLPMPKRLRVQARQAFVYAEAGRLGWDGPWRDALSHGLDFMLSAFRRDDGLFRPSVTMEGTPLEGSPDLYDQAFVLFALAAGYAALGRPAELMIEAEALLDRLEQLLSHPERGFEEAQPRRLPLRSNPHMHMLEAMLAWVEVGGGARFSGHARAIAALATDRLIDPETGAVGEYFDGSWGFIGGVEGTIREPGHQFEWAYLLDRVDRILGCDHRSHVARLHDFGTRHGVKDGRAIFAVDAAGRPLDASSRLWAQTERLRTMLMVAEATSAAGAYAGAIETLGVIRRFFDVPVKGLWRDRVDASGEMLDEPAPASSFYHIMTGFAPLLGPIDRVSAQPAVVRSFE